MGRNKLLASLRGKPIVRHVVESAVASAAEPVIIVTGNAGTEITAALEDLNVRFYENRDYSLGLSESLRSGVNCVPPHCSGALVLLADMPFISAATIDMLIKAFDPEHSICVPTYQGRRGNPVLWGRQYFGDILALSGDKGAKSLMGLHAEAVCEVEVDDEGVLIDIDTAEDLQQHQR